MNHGTRTGYRQGCRETCCREAQRRSMKQYRVRAGLEKRDGRHVFTRSLTLDAGPVREHLSTLLASGWTLTAIASECGLHRETARTILSGKPRCYPTTATLILDLPPLEPVDVDEVAVMRLLDGTLHWQAATLPEREAAGRIAMTRDGGYKFCADVLHLGPGALRRVRDGLAVAS